MVQKTILVKKAKEMLGIEQDVWAKNSLAYEYNTSIESTDPEQVKEAKKQSDAAKFNMDGASKRIAWLEKYIKNIATK